MRFVFDVRGKSAGRVRDDELGEEARDGRRVGVGRRGRVVGHVSL
jgi:hypothetical protein